MTLKAKAGAIATAVFAAAVFFGVGETGARAEAETAASAAVVVPDLALDQTGEQTAGQTPRFIAEEVVQPLPGDVEGGTASAPAASLHELVADMTADTELSRDLRCLAEAIYFEARGEPLAGQLAVGQVIINRAESGLFPGDYCSVVTQRGQFSFVKGGRIPAVKERSAAWSRAHAIARIAHQDLWESEVGDALFFHATYVRPSWASRKVARATIDRHVFYR